MALYLIEINEYFMRLPCRIYVFHRLGNPDIAFYDIDVIAHTMPLKGEILMQAVKATFERRNTTISPESLYVFSDDFKHNKDKQVQWIAFLNKNNLNSETDFDQVVDDVQQLLEPVYQSIANQDSYKLHWFPKELQWKK